MTTTLPEGISDEIMNPAREAFEGARITEEALLAGVGGTAISTEMEAAEQATQPAVEISGQRTTDGRDWDAYSTHRRQQRALLKYGL